MLGLNPFVILRLFIITQQRANLNNFLAVVELRLNYIQTDNLNFTNTNIIYSYSW